MVSLTGSMIVLLDPSIHFRSRAVSTQEENVQERVQGAEGLSISLAQRFLPNTKNRSVHHEAALPYTIIKLLSTNFYLPDQHRSGPLTIMLVDAPGVFMLLAAERGRQRRMGGCAAGACTLAAR